MLPTWMVSCNYPVALLEMEHLADFYVASLQTVTRQSVQGPTTVSCSVSLDKRHSLTQATCRSLQANNTTIPSETIPKSCVLYTMSVLRREDMVEDLLRMLLTSAWEKSHVGDVTLSNRWHHVNFGTDLFATCMLVPKQYPSTNPIKDEILTVAIGSSQPKPFLHPNFPAASNRPCSHPFI